MSSSRAVSLGDNTAGAEGAVYVNCEEMGLCAEVFAETNTLGVLPQLPKVECSGTKLSAYGNFIATKPSQMKWHKKDNSSIQVVLIPGQQPLTLSVMLFDCVGQPEGSLVIGSEDVSFSSAPSRVFPTSAPFCPQSLR
jgi:hypothetical protein